MRIQKDFARGFKINLKDLRKLKDSLENGFLPKENFIFTIFRHELELCAPHADKMHADFLDRVMPRPGTAMSKYCIAKPELWCSLFTEEDVATGVVPASVRRSVSEMVYATLIEKLCSTSQLF